MSSKNVVEVGKTVALLDSPGSPLIPYSLKPILKWVGGKTQLLPIISANLPKKFAAYHEPFIGGGAVLFALQPAKAHISDANSELINCYQVVREQVFELIDVLGELDNNEHHFHFIRAADIARLTPLQRAVRFIYLNKTCFNGLYRENKYGQCNSSFGFYRNPLILDEVRLLHASLYLNEADITITNHDYQTALENPKKGDFVYLDPPYDPLTKTASFTGYTKQGFNQQDQMRLANLCLQLDKRGVQFLLSNSNTPLIRSLYSSFDIQTVSANRSINCKADARKKSAIEVLIKNY